MRGRSKTWKRAPGQRRGKPSQGQPSQRRGQVRDGGQLQALGARGDSPPAASSWQLWPTRTGLGCGRRRETGMGKRGGARCERAVARPLPVTSQTCRDPRETTPQVLHTECLPAPPNLQSLSPSRHHIPLRHALLPRSKSRGRQQREEQDRGSNYPGAGQQTPSHVKLRPVAVHTPDPECTKPNSSSPQPFLGRLALPLSDPPHQRQLLGVTCNLPQPQALARLSPGSAIPSSCLVFCNISSPIFPLPVLPLHPFIHPEAKVFLTHLAALPLAFRTFQ